MTTSSSRGHIGSSSRLPSSKTTTVGAKAGSSRRNPGCIRVRSIWSRRIKSTTITPHLNAGRTWWTTLRSLTKLMGKPRLSPCTPITQQLCSQKRRECPKRSSTSKSSSMHRSSDFVDKDTLWTKRRKSKRRNLLSSNTPSPNESSRPWMTPGLRSRSF